MGSSQLGMVWGLHRISQQIWKTMWIQPAWRLGLPRKLSVPFLAERVKASISEEAQLGHVGRVWSFTTLGSIGQTRWKHPVSDYGTRWALVLFEPTAELSPLFPLPHATQLWYLSHLHWTHLAPLERGSWLVQSPHPPRPLPLGHLVISL